MISLKAEGRPCWSLLANMLRDALRGEKTSALCSKCSILALLCAPPACLEATILLSYGRYRQSVAFWKF